MHEAALDRTRWSSSSALIDEAHGTHGSTVACGDGESEEDNRVYFMWTCLRGQRRQDLERLWLETHYPLDEGIPRLRQLLFHRLIPINDHYTEAELRTPESYNALRTPRPCRACDQRVSGRARRLNNVRQLTVQPVIESAPQTHTSPRMIVVANSLVLARCHVSSVIVRLNDLLVAVSGTSFVVGTYTTRGYP